MKRKFDNVSIKERKEMFAVLSRTAASMHDRDAMNQFLEQLLTPSEKLMLGRRIKIAQLLLQGYSQSKINEQLHFSPNTTSKVHKWLREQLPGYGDAIAKLQEEARGRHEIKRAEYADTKQKQHYPAPFSFKALCRRYPQHFLLFNIATALIDRDS